MLACQSSGWHCPKCKYQNDADELLKDQFIFGIYNKEIQDHLLGEIKETDNSVRVTCMRPEKIESKLGQRKLLGIVTPTALSVEAINPFNTKPMAKYSSKNEHNEGGEVHVQLR